ncbi:MAG: stage V sporulation protein SpoVM [Oscillospiraceae bacterium]|nr:stage V sporulation protein SpoVM [Oscillospiraceae bacterium]MBQ9695923.1 stage V sporulation protein SpoVM [Oscillospiraceae bacterium]MBR1459976.1 stage V sporulation protein SpoVM [Oscillospiraceae bacterium]
MHILQYHHIRRSCSMKIVVIRSPKLLSGIFRLVFHIKKEDCE